MSLEEALKRLAGHTGLSEAGQKAFVEGRTHRYVDAANRPNPSDANSSEYLLEKSLRNLAGHTGLSEAGQKAFVEGRPRPYDDAFSQPKPVNPSPAAKPLGETKTGGRKPIAPKKPIVAKKPGMSETARRNVAAGRPIVRLIESAPMMSWAEMQELMREGQRQRF